MNLTNIVLIIIDTYMIHRTITVGTCRQNKFFTIKKYNFQPFDPVGTGKDFYKY